ncbi:26548_t:CDS:2 [Dentiscutata erythropus]|uniref:26548_t:CDS:1 n=1 Tax=Dentiscutata erythropus TaxID=1348616 RepID=A0A9N9JC07_9GLOM|nr:26548_t:CDS:2 [Dentiscutata erythropus]
MYDKLVFKPPLTAETFHNGNRSFATSKGYTKPFHKHNLSSKKVRQKSQLQVNTKKSISNNITGLKQSDQAMRKISGNVWWQNYKVIRLGHYPSISKFTQKKNGVAYQIPDEYEIKTTLLGLYVRCKTEYNKQTGKIKYIVSWVNSYENIVSSSSMSSASNAGNKFLMLNKF